MIALPLLEFFLIGKVVCLKNGIFMKSLIGVKFETYEFSIYHRSLLLWLQTKLEIDVSPMGQSVVVDVVLDVVLAKCQATLYTEYRQHCITI